MVDPKNLTDPKDPKEVDKQAPSVSKARRLIRLFRREEGATLAEYGLLLALIAVICIAAISLLGNKISNMFSTLSSSI
jgi:pilus assembly protein Flp/PilA